MSDPLAEALKKAILDLIFVKTRLPVLNALTRALAEQAPPNERYVRNHSVYRLVADSYDMAVIDLASLRDRIVKRNGFPELLQQNRGKFVRYAAGDMRVSPTVWLNGAPAPEEVDRHELERRTDAAARVNEVVDELFPAGVPPDEEAVSALIAAFEKATKVTDQDRNQVRAHRYENPDYDGSRFRLTLDRLSVQITIFEDFLLKLLAALTQEGHGLDPPLHSAPEITAADIADLVLHGSIHNAVKYYARQAAIENPMEYGLVRRQVLNARLER